MTNIHTFVCMYVHMYVCKWVAREHHFLVNLKNLSNELFVACPHWKENMRPSSRDYSINTATLDPTKPKTWLLRAVLAIHALLLRPLRDPKDEAQCFRVLHVYMYVCMYLSPLLQFHHGVFHNIFVAYSIMAYTQIATGLQVIQRNNVLKCGCKNYSSCISATSMEEQCFG